MQVNSRRQTWTPSCSPHSWEQSPVPPHPQSPPSCAGTGWDVLRILDPKLPSRSAPNQGISIPAVTSGPLGPFLCYRTNSGYFLRRVSGISGNSADFLCSVVVQTEVVEKKKKSVGFLFSILEPSDGDRILSFLEGIG